MVAYNNEVNSDTSDHVPFHSVPSRFVCFIHPLRPFRFIMTFYSFHQMSPSVRTQKPTPSLLVSHKTWTSSETTEFDLKNKNQRRSNKTTTTKKTNQKTLK